MSKLIALDDGHGLNTVGKHTPNIPELGRQIKENEFNSSVVALLDVELKRCGFKTLLVAPTDKDTPLQERVDLANNMKVDIYVSIHFDAYDGKFDGHDPSGLSVHIYGAGGQAERLAKCVHKQLVKGTVQKDRGVRVSNFYVLRKTKMPAILTENGFMDNKREAMLMLDKDFQDEVAEEHCRGICNYFGVHYIPKEAAVVAEKPKAVPEEIPHWKTVGITYLQKRGILDDSSWLDKIDQAMPVWAVTLLLAKMHQDLKGDE